MTRQDVLPRRERGKSGMSGGRLVTMETGQGGHEEAKRGHKPGRLQRFDAPMKFCRPQFGSHLWNRLGNGAHPGVLSGTRE